MKKILISTFFILTLFAVMVSCSEKANLPENTTEEKNTTSTAEVSKQTTALSITTKSQMNILVPDYENFEEDEYLYPLDGSGTEIPLYYIVKSKNEKIEAEPEKKHASITVNGTEYKLRYVSSEIRMYDDYIVDLYKAYPLDADIDKTEYTFTARFIRGNDNPLNLISSKIFFEEVESQDISDEEYMLWLKEKAKKYNEYLCLGLNIDECEVEYTSFSTPQKNICYFYKCIDGVRTREWLALIVDKETKGIYAFQTIGTGNFKEYENMKIDMDAIKELFPTLTSIMLINDGKQLCAEINYEVEVDCIEIYEGEGEIPDDWIPKEWKEKREYLTYIPIAVS